MTAVAHLDYAPDHTPAFGMHTWPVRVEAQPHTPGVQRPLSWGVQAAQTDCASAGAAPTRGVQVSVEDRARGLCEGIVAKLGLLSSPAARYRAMAYWRAALERAAMEMTARGDAELVALADSGMSAARIAQALSERGCPLSKSGVEAALKRGRAARRRIPDVRLADLDEV